MSWCLEVSNSLTERVRSESQSMARKLQQSPPVCLVSRTPHVLRSVIFDINTAYRLMVESSALEKDEDFTSVIDPRESYTTMIMGHDRRIIMGPARGGSIYSIVAMVPDGEHSTLGEKARHEYLTKPLC